MAKQLEITLVRSTIGSNPKQRKTIEALGLRKLQQTVVHPDNEAIRGMVAKVKHLLDVKEIDS